MNVILSIIGTGCAASVGGFLLADRLKKQKQLKREVFNTLSFPILPKSIELKQNYGFYERDLYIIKSHRKKESTKVEDACLLANQIYKLIQENLSLVSGEVLENFYEAKGIEIGLREMQQDPESLKNPYVLNQAVYSLKKSKLKLVAVFMVDLQKTAQKAGVLTGTLKELFDFYPVFIDHLIENELIAVDATPAVVEQHT